MSRENDPENLHSLGQFGCTSLRCVYRRRPKAWQGLGLVVARACTVMGVIRGGASFSNSFMAEGLGACFDGLIILAMDRVPNKSANLMGFGRPYVPRSGQAGTGCQQHHCTDPHRPK